MSKMMDRLKVGKTPLKKRESKRQSEATKKIMSHKNGDFLNIPPMDLMPDPNQPRKTFYDSETEELGQSIGEVGVLQPLLVRFTENKFWIVAGERRYRASILAGMKTVPCIVTTGNPEEISLIENIQREDLKPDELAGAISKMMEKHGYNQSSIAKLIGKSRKTVSEILLYNKIPDEAKKELSGMPDISRRAAIEVARQPTTEKAIEAARLLKEGATSQEIQRRRTQTINRSSAEEILSRKIQAVIKALDGLESHKRLKRPIVKELRDLQNKLTAFLR